MLINKKFIQEYLTKEAPWHEGHGALEDYLGFGMLYYSIAYSIKAKDILILGSGGGFVPRIFLQCQHDLEMSPNVKLVDGNMGDWGRPQWLDENSFFRKNFNDIEIIFNTTENAYLDFKKNNMEFDIIHIDADHSYNGVKSDFNNYKNLIRKSGIILIHDTSGILPCAEYINDIKNNGYEVINFKEYYKGVALIKF